MASLLISFGCKTKFTWIYSLANVIFTFSNANVQKMKKKISKLVGAEAKRTNAYFLSQTSIGLLLSSPFNWS